MKQPKEPTEKELDQAIKECAAFFAMSRVQFVQVSRPMPKEPEKISEENEK